MSKALVFATDTVIEIFQQHLVSKALVFATAIVLVFGLPTEAEIFYQDL